MGQARVHRRERLRLGEQALERLRARLGEQALERLRARVGETGRAAGGAGPRSQAPRSRSRAPITTSRSVVCQNGGREARR